MDPARIKAMEILGKIVEKMPGTLYGLGAEMYRNDPEKAPMFLGEVEEQTRTNYVRMEPYWGRELLDEIIEYCKANPEVSGLKPPDNLKNCKF